MSIKISNIAFGVAGTCFCLNAIAFGAIAWSQPNPKNSYGAVLNVKTRDLADRKAIELCLSQSKAFGTPESVAACQVRQRIHGECAVQIFQKDGTPTSMIKVVPFGTQSKASQEMHDAQCPDDSCIASPLCDTADQSE